MASPSAAGASLEAALERHRPRIYRQLRRMVGNRADAEDLTQETLLRAHRRLGELGDPAALGPWLRQIARNACLDFLRRTSCRQAPGSTRENPVPDIEKLVPDTLSTLSTPVPDMPLVPDIAAPGLPPDALADRAAMNACGAELLRTLPPRDRRVLVLHDLQGLTSAEIARLLGSTPGAVKIRLHRARERFRAALRATCELYRDERGVLLGGRKPRRR